MRRKREGKGKKREKKRKRGKVIGDYQELKTSYSLKMEMTNLCFNISYANEKHQLPSIMV